MKPPIHKWVLDGETRLDQSRFFVYRCVRCKAQVRNGEIHPPALKECN